MPRGPPLDPSQLHDSLLRKLARSAAEGGPSSAEGGPSQATRVSAPVKTTYGFSTPGDETQSSQQDVGTAAHAHDRSHAPPHGNGPASRSSSLDDSYASFVNPRLNGSSAESRDGSERFATPRRVSGASPPSKPSSRLNGVPVNGVRSSAGPDTSGPALRVDTSSPVSHPRMTPQAASMSSSWWPGHGARGGAGVGHAALRASASVGSLLNAKEMGEGASAGPAWHLNDAEHRVVCGMGGAFLHPTHVFAGARLRPVADTAAGPVFIRAPERTGGFRGNGAAVIQQDVVCVLCAIVEL